MISQHFYPEIGSAGNRIKNIYKLLKDENYDVNVLTTEPTYPNKKIYHDEQFWDDESIDEENDVTCQQRFKFPQFQRNEIPHYERLNRCLGRINSCFFLFSQTVGVTLDVKCNRMM